MASMQRPEFKEMAPEPPPAPTFSWFYFSPETAFSKGPTHNQIVPNTGYFP